MRNGMRDGHRHPRHNAHIPKSRAHPLGTAHPAQHVQQLSGDRAADPRGVHRVRPPYAHQRALRFRLQAAIRNLPRDHPDLRQVQRKPI